MKYWLLLLLAPSCFASEVKLAWDASPTEGATNYVLYASTNAISREAEVRIGVGTNQSARILNLPIGRWNFAVTVIKEGVESDFSNILTSEVPQPPARLYTVVIQYGGSLTNFYDVGYFRLRIP